MDFRNFRHKGLKRFVEHNDPSGLPPDFVEKIGNILSFLQEMESAEELKSTSFGGRMSFPAIGEEPGALR